MAYIITEEQRKQVEQTLGKPVFVFSLLLNDEGTEETHALVTKPNRPTVSAWLAMKDRDAMQATEMVLQNILIPGHFDPTILTDDDLFFQCYALVRQLMMVRTGELKKSLNSSSSDPDQNKISI